MRIRIVTGKLLGVSWLESRSEDIESSSRYSCSPCYSHGARRRDENLGSERDPIMKFAPFCSFRSIYICVYCVALIGLTKIKEERNCFARYHCVTVYNIITTVSNVKKLNVFYKNDYRCDEFWLCTSSMGNEKASSLMSVFPYELDQYTPRGFRLYTSSWQQ